MGFGNTPGFALGFSLPVGVFALRLCLGLALDKGAPRIHRLGDGGVFAGAVDEVEQLVALLTGCFVLPPAPLSA